MSKQCDGANKDENIGTVLIVILLIVVIFFIKNNDQREKNSRAGAATGKAVITQHEDKGVSSPIDPENVFEHNPSEKECRLRWHNPDSVAFARNQLQVIKGSMRTEEVLLSNGITMHLWTPLGKDVLHQNIKAYIWAAYRIYRKVFDLSTSIPFTINLIVLPDNQTYQQYLQLFGSNNPSHSQGIYFGTKNTAFVDYINDSQALKVAIHETLHVFNYRILGLSPRWLNEGVAQNFEHVANMSIRNPSLVFPMPESAVDAFDFNTLLAMEGNWEVGSNRPRLYLSAHTAVSYFMSSPERLAVFKKILNSEQAEVCVRLTRYDILDIFNEHHLGFEADYYDWLNGALLAREVKNNN